MPTPQRPRFPLTSQLYGNAQAARRPLTLVDVGCSGGIIGTFDAFGSHLQAIGFDVLESEIERLAAAERRPAVRYEAAMVGLRDAQEAERRRYEASLPPAMRFDSGVRDRSSGTLARHVRRFDHEREVFNAGADVRHSARRVALDDYAAERRLSVDVLKVDTDGADMEVLLGAESVLTSGCLCVLVESMFHSPLSRYANSFARIDRFLRERGFSLFNLQAFGYTRAALPGPFFYDMFAQTRNGQIDWTDCAYLRDLAAPGYSDAFGFTPDAEQVIALACLFEQLDLSDCAADLIATHADRLPFPAADLLDLLVPDTLGEGLDHREFIRRFESDPAALFPSRQQRRVIDRQPRAVEHVAVVPVSGLRPERPWGSTVVVHDGSAHVTTAALPWAYAAVVALPVSSGQGLVSITLRVEHGRVGVALMGTSHQELLSEILVAASEGSMQVHLPVADLSRPQFALIRNATGVDQGSVAIVERIDLLRG